MMLNRASRETVLQQRQENRPILKAAANAMVNRLSKGRHVIAEHPLMSEAYDQDEMAALKPYFDDGRLMKVSGYGCDVGYRDENDYPIHEKGFASLPTCPQSPTRLTTHGATTPGSLTALTSCLEAAEPEPQQNGRTSSTC